MFAPDNNAQDDKTPKKRFGLIPARIGAQFAHKILIELPLTEPEFPTSTGALGARSRTKISTSKPHYAYVTKNGVSIPSRALPGATVMLDVQDVSRLEEESEAQVKWYCMHRDCVHAGGGTSKRFEKKDDLFRAHAKNKDLIEEAQRDPNGQAHVYIGILEIPATPEVAELKDDKTGKVTRPAQPAQLPTAMLVSDVE